MEPLSDADVALGYVLQQAGLTIENIRVWFRHPRAYPQVMPHFRQI